MITTVIVCGSREFGCYKQDGKLVVVRPERNFIHDVLTAAAGYDEHGNPLPLKIVHGPAETGAGRIAKAWADKHMMPRSVSVDDAEVSYCIAFPCDAEAKEVVQHCDEAGIQVFIPSWS